MTARDPVQRVVDGATLALDAYQAGQLDAPRETLKELEDLAVDLRRQIKDIESRRNQGLVEDLQRQIPAPDPDEHP